MLTTFTKVDDEVVMESIGCTIKMADLYENVKFKPRPEKLPDKEQNVKPT